MDDDACNEQLLGLEMRRLNNNEGTDDLYNNIANIYKKDWYKIEEPQNSDADIGTFGQYEVKEWQVYVHIKSLPLMYVSTKTEDINFEGTINDLYVDNIMVKEWETETSEG